MCLNGMILNPGKKLVPLEGPEQVIVFGVFAGWRVIGGHGSTTIVVFLVLLFLIVT
jgi:hypothetical protein